ncbi:hypothetical protein H7J51_06985 [Mycobacterium crocinum]|uniref:DUF7159 domain-containing protein n=1 Tax=Mycolicibacterium crocinum TaxID=388459 RepID=A0ABY3TLI7_9MYCO|nr:hypothetical protein [Mycolicibacterium crocinum]MCV7215025.1 hypothetical protein [Mycolicibacterium crocinum]ULN42088.1 hypothetical protein MI149_02880 [Mycolicibacterium crocinum]
MDIALGVSMTPTAVRMVLVEGEKADGVTVDHDAFDIETGEGAATAADQVVTAILGTRESAAEGGHRLVSTGITWTDHAAAAGVRDALAARKIDDVILVSELHAAGALAQAVGQTVGYDRTALMFLERDTATVSVVDTATGDIVKVQTEHLHAQDAVAELQRMLVGLEAIAEPPQGVFVLGSGVDVAAVKSQLALGTTLPVHAPDEAELALARGAALASATAPRYDASTVGLAYAQDPDGTTAGKIYPAAGAYPAGASTEMSEAGTQMAAAGYMAPLGYSEVLDELDGDLGYDAVPAEELDFAPDDSGRKPFLLVGSALTSIFVVGVVALVISLAVSIRPTVDQRPSPAESVIVPSSQPAAPAVQQAAPPAPPSAPSVPDTIQEPIPVVQQAPRTVFVTPAPQAPAPAPAAPAPAPAAPAPVPEAPVPAPAPIAPVIPAPILPPPVIVLPPPLLPPFLRPPRPRDYPTYPSSPNHPSYPSTPPTQPSYPSTPPTQPSYPSTPSTPQQPSQPSAPVTEAPSYPAPAAGGSGSGGYGGGSGGYGSGSGSGSGSSSGSEGSDGSRSSGSGGSRSGGGSQSPLWPFPSFGH